MVQSIFLHNFNCLIAVVINCRGFGQLQLLIILLHVQFSRLAIIRGSAAALTN